MVRTIILAALFGAIVASQAAAKYPDVRDPAARERVVASLRESGQNGLNFAMDAYDQLQKQQAIVEQAILRYETEGAVDKASYGKDAKGLAPQDRVASARQRLDTINAQLASCARRSTRSAVSAAARVSRLYWHTDFARGTCRGRADRPANSQPADARQADG